VAFELGRAGHILGSCHVRLENRRTGEAVVFSGDLGNRDTPILKDPEAPGRADVLYLESTYGDRLHGDRTHRMERLAGVLDRSLADGGKVFIPAFSLGRTQELLYELDRIFSRPETRSRHPRLAEGSRPPVFVDSPLGLEITEVYSRLTAFWDAEAMALLADGDHPIRFDGLYAVERHTDHAALLDLQGPAVIIAGSGMCTGGRIVRHLREGIERPENDVVFVGYQAVGTPGRAIQENAARRGTVAIDGRRCRIEARVHTLTGYSAHADQKGLLDWVEGMPERPASIHLVHGDPEARRALAEQLSERGYGVAAG
jgi:metallo-beta-lactamase family protein